VFQKEPLKRCTLRLTSAARKRAASFFRQSAFSAVGSLELSVDYTPLKVRASLVPAIARTASQQSKLAASSGGRSGHRARKRPTGVPG